MVCDRNDLMMMIGLRRFNWLYVYVICYVWSWVNWRYLQPRRTNSLGEWVERIYNIGKGDKGRGIDRGI